MATLRIAAPVAFAVLAGLLQGCSSTSTNNHSLPTLASVAKDAPAPGNSATVQGTISAPGGPYLYDRDGRVVFLHGVNAVYKLPPFELYPDPGKPWNFGSADAALMAKLGFNVVRLGMTWQGLEPGTAPANDPSICTKGTPQDPEQWNQTHLNSYLSNLRKTINVLARFHIYTILDMHQDVYNEYFDGEGAPDWAVCTNGVASVNPPGRWSLEYGTAAVGIAYRHFWTNDVVGDLQGEYDRVWAAVARYFRNDPWVVGYDPFNEPFSTGLINMGDRNFDYELQCFYTGRQYAQSIAGSPVSCPPQDPAVGVIPSILASDPKHLIFFEPDIFAKHGAPSFLGPMNFPNLVYNIHVYCSYRNPVTGNPTDTTACESQDAHALQVRESDLTRLDSSTQPKGPAWFVTEFGATSNSSLLSGISDDLDQSLVGWTYWSWEYYGDPTGSADEALLTYKGVLRPTAEVLSRTYPQAVAGTPASVSFNSTTGAFEMTYLAKKSVTAPTVVFVPTEIHYPNGYCASVSGGTVVSAANSDHLEVRNSPHAGVVRIGVTSGSC